ncbi:Peroxiredoxin-4 [Armadillidium vulgare]|nr:Peroxiredoxin-4 [Armadillidium vulgare]
MLKRHLKRMCHTYAGGSVYPNTEGRASGHNLQWTKAMISKPAPVWEATAVIDGEFKNVKLFRLQRKICGILFLPFRFLLLVPLILISPIWLGRKAPRTEGGLGKLSIPLVSDITHTIAKDYGVYLEDPRSRIKVGLFIIDDKGILRQITMNDLPVGRSVDETLRLVQAFQFTDKHGEVCPAGWKPGDATIIPTPEESRKYFKKAHKEL